MPTWGSSPSSSATRRLSNPINAADFLGAPIFDPRLRDKKIIEPNKRSRLERIRAFLTGGGTSGPVKEIREFFRDVLLVLQSRKLDKPKTKGFFQSLRELREYHRQCEEQEARRKAEALAALQEARDLQPPSLDSSIEAAISGTRTSRPPASR